MKIIGIHDGHNSSVSLLVDGKIKGLMQEERLKSEKNFFGFPIESIKTLLQENNLNENDIDMWAFNGLHMPYPYNKEELIDAYQKSASFKSKLMTNLSKTPIYKLYKNKRKINRIKTVQEYFNINENKFVFFDHHTLHAATAYFGCPWKKNNEEILIITQDGSGDGLSGTVSIGKNGEIKKIAETKKEDSLGRIYATVTLMLGMVPLEHEYKLMGMAPYSPSSGMEKSYNVFKCLLEFDNQDGLTWKRKNGLPPMQQIYPYLKDELEFHRFDWISAGIQKYTEEMLVNLVKNAIKKTGIKKVVLSGGTFMNVKANQKISELDEVDNIFVVPSCGDESNSIGAAYQSYYNKTNKIPEPIYHLYYGPNNTDDKTVEKFINELKSKNTVDFEFTKYDNIEEIVGQLLADGQIVARCKGPMEFGARALGNRSILAEADDLQKIQIINNMIKNRDFWMPFAPVMLKERADDYIKNPKRIDAPFMIITFDTKDNYQEIIGGVQQIDKTARPQIVDGKYNKDYYNLLKEYEKRTGKGVLINTSFNLHGLPIVYGPKEALYVFENSGLDYLALGNYIVKKK